MKKQYERSKFQYYYSLREQAYIRFGDEDHYQHRFVTFCRYPRTTQERRWNEAYKGFTRGKRRNLPTTWDDIRPSFAYGKSWKRFTKKRKQYL